MSAKISETTKELLERMGFSDVQVREEEISGRTKLDVRVKEPQDLIGEKGAGLAMFQHIIRRVAARNTFPRPLIDVDVNSYKKMREEVLRDFARDLASRVRAEKRAVELDPMPAFDRRIIHLALANLADLATESMGEGDNRYIVVRPYP